ncbi:MAG: glycosyltransferase [Candidatus Omnitrophica bacterium]|jgi:glycosyltransferase involved in cell wall biosynthesis|nr:glycosyltransferase [Candidatus Omnitrophota bacterium]
MPLISVIMPVYNGAKLVSAAIQSVLEQTFYDFELIIINDGSTDSTLNTITEFNDIRIKVFSQSKQGPSRSRNNGFNKTLGKYIAYLDADDLWTKDKLQKQLEVMQSNLKNSVVYSWTDYIDDCGNFLYPGAHSIIKGDVYQQMLLYDFIESGCSNILVKKTALAEVGGFGNELSMAEDWDLWLRLAKKYHFAFVPSVQVLCRISTSSRSSNFAKVRKDNLKVIERNFDQAPKSLQGLKIYSIYNFYIYLTCKILERFLIKHKSLSTVRYLWYAFNRNIMLRKSIKKILMSLFILTSKTINIKNNLKDRLSFRFYKA